MNYKEARAILDPATPPESVATRCIQLAVALQWALDELDTYRNEAEVLDLNEDPMKGLNYDTGQQGKNLRAVREKMGLTLDAAAALAGLAPAALERVEQGMLCSSSVIRNLIRVYKCGLDDVIKDCITEKT